MSAKLDEIASLFDVDVIEELLLVDDDDDDDLVDDDTVVELFPSEPLLPATEVPEPIITNSWGLLPEPPRVKPKVGLLDFGLKPSC